MTPPDTLPSAARVTACACEARGTCTADTRSVRGGSGGSEAVGGTAVRRPAATRRERLSDTAGARRQGTGERLSDGQQTARSTVTYARGHRWSQSPPERRYVTPLTDCSWLLASECKIKEDKT